MNQMEFFFVKLVLLCGADLEPVGNYYDGIFSLLMTHSADIDLQSWFSSMFSVLSMDKFIDYHNYKSQPFPNRCLVNARNNAAHLFNVCLNMGQRAHVDDNRIETESHPETTGKSKIEIISTRWCTNYSHGNSEVRVDRTWKLKWNLMGKVLALDGS